MASEKMLNKSYLAPLADRFATEQLKLLVLSAPLTILINNYKAPLHELNLLRTLIRQNNGFAYQPNKNIKTRAFKELGTVLSSGSLNGLVVFIFFAELPKALKFLKDLKNEDFYFLSYFAILLEGHLATSIKLDPHLGVLNAPVFVNSSILKLNGSLAQTPIFQFSYCLKKIYLILNAYSKSTSKGS
jgi:hypothetical protein